MNSLRSSQLVDVLNSYKQTHPDIRPIPRGSKAAGVQASTTNHDRLQRRSSKSPRSAHYSSRASSSATPPPSTTSSSSSSRSPRVPRRPRVRPRAHRVRARGRRDRRELRVPRRASLAAEALVPGARVRVRDGAVAVCVPDIAPDGLGGAAERGHTRSGARAERGAHLGRHRALARHVQGGVCCVWVRPARTSLPVRVGYSHVHAPRCNMLLVRQSAPSPNSLGATNGLVHLAINVSRGIGPWLTSAIFAFTVEHNLLNGTLWVWIMIALSVAGQRFAARVPALEKPFMRVL